MTAKKMKFLRFSGYGVLLLFAIFLLLIFVPRTYDVSGFKNIDEVKYWDLSTGSRIGYVLIPAKGLKRPFAIVYLQGGPGGFMSEKLLATLKPLAEDGYDVYCYDQIGSGHSARLADITAYTADRHKRDLKEVVAKTGAEKVILIGQSWGAILAALFVGDHGQLVDRLILTGPGPIPPVNRELAKIQAPDHLHLRSPDYSNAEANAAAHNLRSKATLFCALWFGIKIASDREADNFQTTLNNRLNKSTFCDTSKVSKALGGGGFYVQVMTVNSFAETKDPRPGLKTSQIPVLIMKGQCDNQKWGFTNEYLNLFSNSRLEIIPGAGHAIAAEKPDVYLKVVRGFLK